MDGRGTRGGLRPFIGLAGSLILTFAGVGGAVAWSARAPGTPWTMASIDALGEPARPALPSDAAEPAGGTRRHDDWPAPSVRPSTPSADPVLAPDPPAAGARRATLVVFIPHQDDELLSMGVLIGRQVADGGDVEVVLLTDGSASAGRALVDRRLAGLGLPPLSVGEFASARDRELRASLHALGVGAGHVHPLGHGDGRLTVAQAKEAVEAFASSYPGARLVTTSVADGHADHRAAALGLEQANVGDAIRSWAVARSSWTAGDPPAGCAWTSDPAMAPSLARAAAAYREWDPAAGRYGIAGLSSVPALIEAAAADPRDLICDRPRP